MMVDEAAVSERDRWDGGVAPVLGLHVTPEALLYTLLAVIAVALRFAALGDAPLNDDEARQALGALRMVNDSVPGEATVPDSPLMLALHALTFTFGGLSDAAARFPSALGGVLLVLAPALWRRYLNPLPPLILSLLLAISPVAWLASRTVSPAVWTALLALVGPWLVLRFVETRRAPYAVAATVVFAAMALLVEPAGLITLLALAFGVAFAWLTEDDPDVNIGAQVRELLRAWPWANGAAAAAIVAFALGTLLFFLPSGLTAIGNVVSGFVRGLTARPDGASVAFPLLVALRYEPGIVLFGLLAAVHAVREGGFFERALAGWLLAGIVAGLLYAGASAVHALWVTLPLTVLVALALTRWLTERVSVVWQVPRWGVPLHAAVTMALWIAVGLSLVLLGKQILIDLPAGVTRLDALVEQVLGGLYSRQSNTAQAVEVQGVQVLSTVLGYIQLRALLTILLSLLVGILYFLVGSLWGARTAWHGLALGTLGALMLFGLGAAGHAATVGRGDPRTLWHANPVTDDIRELEETLETMSLRATGTPHLMDITAQVPRDGALAWALRRYPNTTFVGGIGPEVTSAAVIAPQVEPEPVLGASYIGKDLIMRRAWSFDSLSWRDMIMWLYRGASRIAPVPSETIMLWVRADVYGVENVP